MASRKNSHKRKSTSYKNCKGGRRSSKRTRTEKKRKTHKWHQKGCQSGGGSSVTGGGEPWQVSDLKHQIVGGGLGAGAGAATGAATGAAAGAGNGTFYAMNTTTLAHPQSSNHLVEKGQFGGRHSRHHGRKRIRHGRKHRRFIGEQHGGMAEYLPEVANAQLRGVAEVPSSMVNAIQGASTAFKTSNPTIQPIGQPIQLV